MAEFFKRSCVRRWGILVVEMSPADEPCRGVFDRVHVVGAGRPNLVVVGPEYSFLVPFRSVLDLTTPQLLESLRLPSPIKCTRRCAAATKNDAVDGFAARRYPTRGAVERPVSKTRQVVRGGRVMVRWSIGVDERVCVSMWLDGEGMAGKDGEIKRKERVEEGGYG
jgi:hypothetical protein